MYIESVRCKPCVKRRLSSVSIRFRQGGFGNVDYRSRKISVDTCGFGKRVFIFDQAKF
jgi:predicted nucleic acid-binding Zn ribbon protein